MSISYPGIQPKHNDQYNVIIYFPLDINDWNDATVDMRMESGFLKIAPAQFQDEDELNCKIVSPARIMQWILSGK